MIIKKWDLRFLEMARNAAGWSKDPSTKVGSVIVDDDKRVISVGYNGFPKGVADDRRLDDREEKYKVIVHAERNALLFANKDVEGCHMYTYPFMPCSVCAGMIIQSGIKRVVSVKNKNPRWQQDFKVSRGLLYESGVILIEYDRDAIPNDESLIFE
jgi:dCMP deaminase